MSKTAHYIDYVKMCEKKIKSYNKDLSKLASRRYKLHKRTNLFEKEKTLLDELDKLYSSTLKEKLKLEFELQLIKLEAVANTYNLPSKAKKLGLDKDGYIKYLKAEYLTKLDNELSYHSSYDWINEAKNRANEYISNGRFSYDSYFGINSYLRDEQGVDYKQDIYNIFSDAKMESREADKIARR